MTQWGTDAPGGQLAFTAGDSRHCQFLWLLRSPAHDASSPTSTTGQYTASAGHLAAARGVPLRGNCLMEEERVGVYGSAIEQAGTADHSIIGDNPASSSGDFCDIVGDFLRG